MSSLGIVGGERGEERGERREKESLSCLFVGSSFSFKGREETAERRGGRRKNDRWSQDAKRGADAEKEIVEEERAKRDK
jgi:hypothetical protein